MKISGLSWGDAWVDIPRSGVRAGLAMPFTAETNFQTLQEVVKTS